MTDPGVLAELFKSGGIWLVMVGVAYTFLQRIAPSMIRYFNDKAALARKTGDAITKVLEWPDQFASQVSTRFDSLDRRFDKVDQRFEDHTDAIERLSTILEIQPKKPLIRKPKEGINE